MKAAVAMQRFAAQSLEDVARKAHRRQVLRPLHPRGAGYCFPYRASLCSRRAPAAVLVSDGGTGGPRVGRLLQSIG